jgi:tetratricopeptide (TPR) repeat protein
VGLGEEAYALLQSIDNRHGLIGTSLVLAMPYVALGQVDKGLRLLKQALRYGEELRYGFFTWVATLWLARTLGSTGAVTRALELAEQALTAADRALPERRPIVIGLLARLQVRQGNLAAAAELLKDQPLTGFETYLPLDGTDGATDMFMAHAEVRMAHSDYASALHIMDDLIASLQRTETRIQLPNALHLKGIALQASNRTDEAVDTLTEASVLAETMHARLALLPILVALADIESQRGNEGAAKTLHNRARETVDIIVAHTPPDLCELFLNQLHVRAV